MSDPQKNYRIYCYDGSRRILTSDLVEASGDEDAIARAEALGFAQFEVWDGHRLVAQLGEEHQAA